MQLCWPSGSGGVQKRYVFIVCIGGDVDVDDVCVLLTRFNPPFSPPAGAKFGLAGGFSMTFLLSLHPTVAKGLPVVLRLDTILETCYDGDVKEMLLALDGIRSRKHAKFRLAAAANVVARTTGMFQSLCSICVHVSLI